MTVLLSNLTARRPTMDDLEAITRLIMTCDIAEYGMLDATIEDLRTEWRQSRFNLETDAWIIVTARGQLVGFASVWHSAPVSPANGCQESVPIYMYICVHPQYRGRGIGTLLLRLAEERARQDTLEAPAGVRISLRSTVGNVNTTAGRLLEHEGYTLVRTFWRIVIELNEAYRGSYGRDKLKVDLDVDSKRLSDITPLHEQDGLYIIREYSTYEKELRAGEEIQAEVELVPQEVAG